MTSAIDHLYELHSNPFLFSNALYAFFETLGEKEHSVLLAYLVLPIALNSENGKALGKARRTSNLRTFVSKQGRLSALPGRIEDCREVTNATLRYLFSLKAIKASGDMLVVEPGIILPDETSPPGLVLAASVLGRFFKEYQVPAVYRMLGIMAL
jgi:hypothetical protein